MYRSTLANGSVQVDILGTVASDGRVIFPEEMAQTFGYDGAGHVITISVSVPANAPDGLGAATYMQTLTWVGENCTNISVWMKQ